MTTDKQNDSSLAAAADAPVSADADRIAALETQLAEMKDQALRALAEAENTRRRAAKERDDMAKFAVSNFAKDMLQVADNLARALQAAPKEGLDATTKNLVVGVEATERQLAAVLERFGIKRMEPLGQPFDPNFHQVMQEVDDSGKPAGTVVQVLQAGYKIHDRLLREALVVITRSGASPNKD